MTQKQKLYVSIKISDGKVHLHLNLSMKERLFLAIVLLGLVLITLILSDPTVRGFVLGILPELGKWLFKVFITLDHAENAQPIT